jgi:hypothetical protein
MTTLIALYGPQQVGKTTAALSLIESCNFHKVSFADPLYRMMGALLELSVSDVRKLPKNQRMESLGGQTLRHALQTLGTQWGRSLLHKNLWLDVARDKILSHASQGQSVVVDDLRFQNEYDLLKELGCKFVRLKRQDNPEQCNSQHASENDWADFVSHVEVVNPPDGATNWRKQAGASILAALR